MNSIPPPVQILLERIASGFQAVLAGNLVGIYVHGSLAMGCFNPVTSDVDFLAVVAQPLEIEVKQLLIRLTLELAADAPPKGLEFSAVTREVVQHVVYPTPYELHYSRDWHTAYINNEVDLVTPHTDPDLAAHFVITRLSGFVLVGQPVDRVFGEVPESAYWDSIRRDADDILKNITYNPPYSVLNLCRVLAYHREKRITSKLEGARWALDHVETRYHALIKQALDIYQATPNANDTWDDTLLHAFGSAMRRSILEASPCW